MTRTQNRQFPLKSTALAIALAVAGFSSFASAQVIYAPQPQVVVQTPAVNPTLTQDQLNDMTASIALYPDPLLALMFPAATYPDQVVGADAWLAHNANPSEAAIDQTPYQPSVQSLMHYPTVLHMMAEHQDWTTALGLAFVYQQGDLMNSVQYWRGIAQANGTLVTTPEDRVVVEGPSIEILPAAADVIYVPQYDPAVVFVRDHDHRPARDAIRFNVVGHDNRFLDNDLDWHNHVVQVPVRRDTTPRVQNNIRVGDDRPDQPRAVTPARPDAQPAPDRHAFVREALKPDVKFPDRIVMPQPDHKVITPAPRQDTSHAQAPRDNRDNGRGQDNNDRGDANGR